jgi:hypothetical protein
MRIIDDKAKELVRKIDSASGHTPELDADIATLVAHLKAICSNRYVRFAHTDSAHDAGELAPYPLDADGYAVAFDPVEQEAELRETWNRFGVVVSRNVVPAAVRGHAIRKMHAVAAALSQGKCDLDRKETWAHIPCDSEGVPILSRGFFELYHDDAIAALRQAPRLYLHFAIIWDRAEIWTTFDRLGIKLPGHEESAALPLHVDQNPNVHPDFRTVQGVLALADCPAERGTFVAVPGSKRYFPAYAEMAENKGEYIQLRDECNPTVAKILRRRAQKLPLRAGDLVTWDSRTTHANSENVSDLTRYVAYIAAGLAREDDAALVAARAKAFETGVGSNVRDALMHASKPPRFTDPDALARVREPERLTLLGELIYGRKRYSEIKEAPAPQR